MPTILNIKKSGFPDIEKIYSVESLTDLFEAIEDGLKINPSIHKINVRQNINIDVAKWMNENGFDFYNYSTNGEIRFRGFTKWVYFKNDTPVFFDSACSGTDTPPHTTTFRNSVYVNLKFDYYKKITF